MVRIPDAGFTPSPSQATPTNFWILASSESDIGVLPDITAPDIGDLRISQCPYSDIAGVTDIGELRYHRSRTPISQDQNSDIDFGDIGGAVNRISEV